MARVAVVTGATGFIGWHLSSALRDLGWTVRAVTRGQKPVPAGVDRIESALVTDRLVTTCRGADVVFHLAARLHGTRDALDRVNVDGTRAVVAAARELGARLVHVSSLGAAGPAGLANPRAEDDEPSPVNAYGASKLAGEQVVRASDSWWTVLRPPVVYGPGDRQFLPLFRLARRGLFPAPPRADTWYSLIHVDDLVRAIAAAAECDLARHQAIFLAHPQPESAEGILQTLACVFDRRYRPRTFPAAIVRSAARVGDLVSRIGAGRAFDSDRLAELMADGFTCRTDRARALFGFEAEIGIQDGFRVVGDWYRQQGWLI